MSRAIPVQSLMSGLIDASGSPLADGKVYSYEAGTTTPKSLYTTQDKLSTATNPVELNALGQALVYAEGSYKFVVKDSDDALIATFDNLLFDTNDEMARFLGQSAGSSNTYSAEASPSLSAYAEGQTFTFIANHTNTGSATLNIDSLGAKSLVKGSGASALIANEIVSGDMLSVVYESTGGGRFRLVGQYHGYMRALALQNVAGNSLILNCSDAQSIKFYTQGVNRFEVNSSGHIVPNADLSNEIGSSSLRLRRLHTGEVIQPTDYNVTAAGSDQAGATQVKGPFINVSGGGVDAGVRLEAPSYAGLIRVIKNNSGQRIRVYPSSGCSIESAAADAYMPLQAGATALFWAQTATWWCVLGYYPNAQTYSTVGTYNERNVSGLTSADPEIVAVIKALDTLVNDLRLSGHLN